MWMNGWTVSSDVNVLIASVQTTWFNGQWSRFRRLCYPCVASHPWGAARARTRNCSSICCPSSLCAWRWTLWLFTFLHIRSYRWEPRGTWHVAIGHSGRNSPPTLSLVLSLLQRKHEGPAFINCMYRLWDVCLGVVPGLGFFSIQCLWIQSSFKQSRNILPCENLQYVFLAPLVLPSHTKPLRLLHHRAHHHFSFAHQGNLTDPISAFNVVFILAFWRYACQCHALMVRPYRGSYLSTRADMNLFQRLHISLALELSHFSWIITIICFALLQN